MGSCCSKITPLQIEFLEKLQDGEVADADLIYREFPNKARLVKTTDSEGRNALQIVFASLI